MLATSLALSAGTALAAPNPGGQRQRDVFGGYTSSQIVVKLRPEAMATPPAQRHFRTAPHDSDPRAALSGTVRTTAANWRTRKMRPAYSEPFADPAAAARHGLDRTFVIEVPEGTDTEAMAAAFAALGGDIESATVDTIGGVADVIPNDTNFNLQYGMHNTGQTGGTPDADIDAPAAWGLHTGGFGTVTIAIIDSGVNSHTEYGTNNNLLPYPQGRIVQGRNTANLLTPTDTTDGCTPIYHGTHVAGIAAASGNNGQGVAGVTWGAYIMPVRVLNGCGGFVSRLADGIKWAADHGADIGNMSLQYYDLTQTEYNLLSEAIDYAYDLGMILIAATGNTPNGPGITYVAYPARLPRCMAVSATNNRDILASFSHYGNEVDVCAPGEYIYSTYVNNGYQYLSGTSMATPHVSGLAALMKSYVPELTNVDLELILDQSADDKGTPGWDDHYGFGRINAHNALLTADTWRGAIVSSSPPRGAIDARKPTDRDGGNSYGWQSADLTMTVYASLQTPLDFLVTQQGGIVVAPPVTGVAAADDRHLTVTLETIIETRAWTTITHIDSGTSVRLGYLPGNVDANSVSDAADVTAIVDVLSSVLPTTKPIWSLDIDRSEAVTPADVLEVVDLLNGADAYLPYLNAVLP
jgi:subtilisin family serine protease